MASRGSEVPDTRVLLQAQRQLRAEYSEVRNLAPDDPRRVAYGERLKAQRRRLQQFAEVNRRREAKMKDE